jgi:predicted amidohydrolase
MRSILLLVLLAAFALTGADAKDPAKVAAPDGWTTGAPRDEIAPAFAYEPSGGRDGKGAFVIVSDGRPGLDGYWTRRFPVSGGKHYRFRASSRATGLQWPQQNVLATIHWHTAEGKRVLDDRKLVENVLPNYNPYTPTEYPRTKAAASDGWLEHEANYQAPGGAAFATVELHSRWAAKGRVEWSGVDFAESQPPAPRKVRLATAHFRPTAGRSPEKNRELFTPMIEEAARQKADLVVLPETLTYFGTGLTPVESAEPVPGPSTEFFGALARKHNLYIVAGIFERDGPLVYNVAVLLTPEGKLGGKYRKVTLPDSEVEAGVAPGNEYPVFRTRFGVLGMMICYDGFFPEVARELTKKGAEVIAWPVWGCNPDLAKARAAENHVYLVSSTYEDISHNWMLSAVYDHAGRTVALAKDWGTIALAEVDLEEPTRWKSLGDFRSKIPRHVPMARPAETFAIE